MNQFCPNYTMYNLYLIENDQLVFDMKISHSYEPYDLPYGNIGFNSYTKYYFRDNLSQKVVSRDQLNIVN